jgi:hypothetical protein
VRPPGCARRPEDLTVSANLIQIAPGAIPSKGGVDKRRAVFWPTAMNPKLVLLLLFTVALLSKHLDQLLAPQFFSDDGGGFFMESVSMGWSSVLHVYNSFLYVVPRVISSTFCSIVPWAWLPLAYNLSAVFITVYIALRLIGARLPRFAGPLMAIALVTVLHNGDVFINLCCSHVFFGVLLVVNLLEPAPIRPGETIRRMVEAMLAALSGPEAIILAPFMLWGALRWRKEPRGWLVLGSMAAGAAIEAAAMCIFPRELDTGWSVAISQFLPVVPYYSQGIFCSWCGSSHAYLVGVIVALIVSSIFGFLFCESGNPYRVQTLLFLVCAALFLIAGKLAAGWANPLGNGARYTYLPFVLVWWSLAWLLIGSNCWIRRSLAASLILAIVASSTTRWSAYPYPDYHWRQQVSEVQAGKRTMFIVPPDWKIPVPHRR